MAIIFFSGIAIAKLYILKKENSFKRLELFQLNLFQVSTDSDHERDNPSTNLRGATYDKYYASMEDDMDPEKIRTRIIRSRDPSLNHKSYFCRYHQDQLLLAFLLFEKYGEMETNDCHRNGPLIHLQSRDQPKSISVSEIIVDTFPGPHDSNVQLSNYGRVKVVIIDGIPLSVYQLCGDFWVNNPNPVSLSENISHACGILVTITDTREPKGADLNFASIARASRYKFNGHKFSKSSSRYHLKMKSMINLYWQLLEDMEMSPGAIDEELEMTEDMDIKDVIGGLVSDEDTYLQENPGSEANKRDLLNTIVVYSSAIESLDAMMESSPGNGEADVNLKGSPDVEAENNESLDVFMITSSTNDELESGDEEYQSYFMNLRTSL
ncbi:hypothetical protein K501DRAFT_278880 [Backusella circina FSU 941]|nr:hypothetical protein K501DRAFT_278880 [Backusella circina FSU 941]